MNHRRFCSLALVAALGLSARADARAPLRFALIVQDNTIASPAMATYTIAPLARHIGKRVGEQVSFEYMPSVATLKARLQKGSIDFVISSALTYVQLRRQKLDLAPIAVAQRQGSHRDHVRLVVRRGSKLKHISDLKGRSISVNKTHLTTWIYLRALLNQSKLGEPDAFFSSVRTPSKRRSAVLDVLLGEADACVTTDTTLQAMAQLNPQVKSRLVAIAGSEPLARPVVFARRGAPQLDKTRRLIHDLHHQTKGKQLLMIFRIERFSPIKPGLFRSYLELVDRVERLRTKPAGR